jgi:hypothetical protein
MVSIVLPYALLGVRHVMRGLQQASYAKSAASKHWALVRAFAHFLQTPIGIQELDSPSYPLAFYATPLCTPAFSLVGISDTPVPTEGLDVSPF